MQYAAKRVAFCRKIPVVLPQNGAAFCGKKRQRFAAKWKQAEIQVSFCVNFVF
jgi:hypothetical protein